LHTSKKHQERLEVDKIYLPDANNLSLDMDINDIEIHNDDMKMKTNFENGDC